MFAFLIVFLALCHRAFSILPELTEEELRLLPAEFRTNIKPRLHASPPRVANTRVGLKHLYVDNHGRIHSSPQSSHTITISATNRVGNTALRKAATVIALMTRHMPSTVFNNVASEGDGVGIFAHPEKITVFPELAYLKAPPECSGNKCSRPECSTICYSDGRKYEDMTGLTTSISVVIDDTVLCTEHSEHHVENILVHEFAHQVYNYMPYEYVNKTNYIFNHDKQHHIWQNETYALSNSDEFWAEVTAAFFRVSVRPDVHSATGGMNICNFERVCRNEAENRQWLKKHDAPLYNVLAKVYTNNHPSIPSGLKVCQ